MNESSSKQVKKGMRILRTRVGILLGLLVLALVVNLAISTWLMATSKRAPAKVKVENDGGIVMGISTNATAGPAFDPYFVQVNHIEHISH
jgi:hypothetical protein